MVYDVILYQRTFAAEYASEDEKRAAYSRCHKRSAERVLEALQANGGIYIKLVSRPALCFLSVGTF